MNRIWLNQVSPKFSYKSVFSFSKIIDKKLKIGLGNNSKLKIKKKSKTTAKLTKITISNVRKKAFQLINRPKVNFKIHQ
jgi:hypothetical protein